ncbi:DUF4410 domain-containing protein [Siccirubricoccus sp. G192]|uniref:DUF4410 domain-containing protein n=1 Tax=Siccirubricoccus sp. G192 TaxID=2849651 RepID=UPI001C2BFC73|nr:DUF4410 domain-containing protein [Siccirubricoccus sp. G192]MBV1799441.1 DUF4410 domain-containing protein [Siccirubricoccus sp. G192]
MNWLAPTGRGFPARSLAVLAILGCVSCSQPRVDEVRSYAGAPLPQPERILVLDFAVTPQDVRLDQGIGARLMRAASGGSSTGQQLAAARATSSGLAEELVAHFRSLGLRAERVSSLQGIGPGRVAVVEGQLVSVDEGNRTRRTLIGLGAGRSSVTADAQLYYVERGAQPRLLESFEASADSGRAPGMAETMGAGAVAGRLATSAAVGGGMHGVLETSHADSADEGKGIGKALARKLAQFFAQQGWVSAAALR